MKAENYRLSGKDNSENVWRRKLAKKAKTVKWRRRETIIGESEMAKDQTLKRRRRKQSGET